MLGRHIWQTFVEEKRGGANWTSLEQAEEWVATKLKEFPTDEVVITRLMAIATDMTGGAFRAPSYTEPDRSLGHFMRATQKLVDITNSNDDSGQASQAASQ